MKLIINGTLPSRNEAENAARTHWAKAAKMKKHYTELIACECKVQKIPKYTTPIHLTVTFYEKDMRRDSDNIYAAMKYIKDGLVMAGIVPNDNRKWVTETINPIEVDKLNPRIEIEVQNG